MRIVPAWQQHIPDKDSLKSIVYDIAYSPDGNYLAAACGARVLVFNAGSGEQLHTLKGHKDQVHCVSWSRDGAFFASGGADKSVIVWQSSGEGLLKFAHSDSLQAVAYNPMQQVLASIATTDFGIWSKEVKQVQKTKLPSRGLCCSWTSDGTVLAIGLFGGDILIYDRTWGEKDLKISIKRSEPIWSLAWNPNPLPSKNDSINAQEALSVACWDQTLSFYGINGQQIGKDKKLGFDPLCVSFFNSGDFMLVSGTNRKTFLFNREGIKLSVVSEGLSDWIWACRTRPVKGTSFFVALGCNNGAIACHQIVFNTVHGLFDNRYAYRDRMTDVIIQHLVTEEKVRIKCRDYIKKIAVYRDKIAVQLPDRVLIYQLNTPNDDADMHYVSVAKIQRSFECNLLVITSNHFILCQEMRLQLYDFQGNREREWILDSVIRYIKVVGGAIGREGLLVGLKDGQILKIFVDNPFPQLLLKHSSCIRCLDLSMSRRQLAVVDDTSTAVIYDVVSNRETYRDSNVSSVAFNSVYEDMLCYSGQNTLSIRTSDFEPHREKLVGFVVGVKGSKVFCLQMDSMKTVDVPQSASMHKFLQKGDIIGAHAIALLGVTESDWRLLGDAALRKLEFDLARQAYIRVRDVRTVTFIKRLEAMKKDPRVKNPQLSALIHCFHGNFTAASAAYCSIGMHEAAIEMFSELRMYKEAQRVAQETAGVDVNALFRKQALWEQESGDKAAAARLWVALGEWSLAVSNMVAEGMVDDLVKAVRKIPAEFKDAFGAAVGALRKLGKTDIAIEAVMKSGDAKLLCELYMECGKWQEAFKTAEAHSDLLKMVHAQHAAHLVQHDRFEDAMQALLESGQSEGTSRMLVQLLECAVLEQRFNDASHFNFLLYRCSLEAGATTEQASHHLLNAWLYHAFAAVFEFTTQPFSYKSADCIFHAASVLVNTLFFGGKRGNATPPPGITASNVFFAIIKVADGLGAHKAMRAVLDKMKLLRFPANWRSRVELAAIMALGRPFTDPDELCPRCARCGTPNSIIRDGGDACLACKQPFYRSYVGFEPLPVVEFQPESGIMDEEAEELLRSEPLSLGAVAAAPGSSAARKERDLGGGVFSMSFDDADAGNSRGGAPAGGGSMSKNDPFFTLIYGREVQHQIGASFKPLVAGRSVLQALSWTHVLIYKPPGGGRYRYLRNMVPDAEIVQCSCCGGLFLEEDWEEVFLERGACPFCRSAAGPENKE